MGFNAPSAEEVSRYALRLDRRGSLVDRFGFGIILVNDNSPFCQEFLTKYLLEDYLLTISSGFGERLTQKGPRCTGSDPPPVA